MIGTGNLSSSAMQVLAPLQGLIAESPRRSLLADKIAAILPDEPLSAVDIGCGLIDGGIHIDRPLKMIGLDIETRPHAPIPVMSFDGSSIPFPNKSVDVAFLVNFLHRCDDPLHMLSEAVRVAKRYVVIKDYFCETVVDETVLNFLGRLRAGTNVTSTALSRREWLELFAEANVNVQSFQTDLRLSSRSLSVLFDRPMHVLTHLAV